MGGAHHLLPRIGLGVRIGMLDGRSAVGDRVLRLIPEQLLHTLADVVQRVLEVGNTGVHFRLP